MPSLEKHQHAIRLYHEGSYPEAARALGRLLAEEETAELWNDWATTQLACSRPEEAEEGYRRALELEAGYPGAVMNLGVLLATLGRHTEARPYLEQSLTTASGPERDTLLRLMEGQEPTPPQGEMLETYLRRFIDADENNQSYFDTHLSRYIATLNLLPTASPGQRLLELGSAHHHLTPALIRQKGYEVRCTDIWKGESQASRRIVDASGREELSIEVDNFDVESAPWPYPDASFDVVLCCELLEHLICDPMLMLSEINRVLKRGGLLLLTTPNIASAKSAEYVLRGESPYVFGHYEREGLPTDHHNREYTAGEVEHLAGAAGFQVVHLRTLDSWWRSSRDVLRFLAAEGYPIARRGDNTLLLARKSGPVRERYPEEFYIDIGTQAERRQKQEGVEPIPRSNVLVIHEVLPLTDRSGSDVRLMQVLRSLRMQGHSVTYIARDARGQDRYAAQLEELGIQVFATDIERLRYIGVEGEPEWTLDEVLRNQHYDLVILFHWFWSGISVSEHYLEDIRRISPTTAIAVLTDDFHGLRERRSAELTGLFSDWERANDFEQREIEVYRRADLVLTISEDDRKKLLAKAPELQTELLPMIAETADAGPAFSEREGLLFVGNFDNLANVDGVRWMLETVWPRVRRKLPDIPLDLVGNNAPRDLASVGPGVACLGHMPVLEPAFLKHRLFVSPIRFGAGIKTKNLAALEHGLPLITTEIGAEGMNLAHGDTALIANTAEEFADAIVRAYTNEPLWQQLARNGREHVRREFSPDRVDSQIRAILRRVRRLKLQRGGVHSWSFRQVETIYPEVISHEPCHERVQMRILAYLRLAEQLFAENKPAEARDQLRHIFHFVRGAVPKNGFFANILEVLANCYSELGEPSAADRCRREARSCRGAAQKMVADRNQAAVQRNRRRSDSEHAYEMSVVVPTYNRRDSLSSCLAALGAQSYPASRFEVVVVDDGSNDGTEDLCKTISTPYALRYIRQTNAGAGMARRTGVENSRGKYLLLINDDTIATPNLLAEHLGVHYANPLERWSVLGDFRYPENAPQRALSYYLSTHPFLFAQASLESGKHYGSVHFVTCNLSIRRDAVIKVGSFDPGFRVGEDTELGVRLELEGFRVYYHANALAWHDHVSMTMDDLIRRARSYGRTNVRLFRKHPHLLGDGTGPYGRADGEAALRIRDYLAAHRADVEEALKALRQFDNVDFLPFFASEKTGRRAADDVVGLFASAVPEVYWYYVFESFLEALTDDRGLRKKVQAVGVA